MPLCAYVHPSVGPHLEKKLFLGGFGSLARLELALRGASVQLRVTARVDSKMQAACWQWLSKVKAVTCMLKQLSCSVTHGRHQLTGTEGNHYMVLPSSVQTCRSGAARASLSCRMTGCDKACTVTSGHGTRSVLAAQLALSWRC